MLAINTLIMSDIKTKILMDVCLDSIPTSMVSYLVYAL